MNPRKAADAVATRGSVWLDIIIIAAIALVVPAIAVACMAFGWPW